jgi:hypothetical protein
MEHLTPGYTLDAAALRDTEFGLDTSNRLAASFELGIFPAALAPGWTCRGLAGHQLLQPRVLTFRNLELLRLRDLHAVVFLAPA